MTHENGLRPSFHTEAVPGSVEPLPGSGDRSSVVLIAFALCGALGVGMGAFGAHALKALVSPSDLEIWKTAVFYLMIHTLAGMFLEVRHPKKGVAPAMLLGIVLFSGSLFLLVLTGVRILGAVTPLGGVCFIVAWCLAARAEWQKSRKV